VRAWAGVSAAGHWTPLLLMASGVLWAGAFAVYLWHAWPVLTGPRDDGLDGCAEPLGSDLAHHAGGCAPGQEGSLPSA
ncbi:MAG: hypothetical protein WBF88_00480, partial [Pusillimonas sp.]